MVSVKWSLELSNTRHDPNLDGILYKVGAQPSATVRASEGSPGH